MSSNKIASTETSNREQVRAREAYEGVRHELAALPADKVLQVNVDIKNATGTAMGCKPGLEALAQELQSQLRTFDNRLIDKLELYAYALLHAQSICERTSKLHDELKPTADQANELKEVLLTDCRSLVCRKLISAALLDGYSGLVGYKIIASDLQLLCTALSSNWERIQGRCATTHAEIEQATRLASRILHLVEGREQAAARLAKAADNRARAFTLLVNCYDEIRRGVSFVRWHEGDLEDIAPSLYARRRRSRQPIASSTSLKRSVGSLPGGSPFIE